MNQSVNFSDLQSSPSKMIPTAHTLSNNINFFRRSSQTSVGSVGSVGDYLSKTKARTGNG